MLLKGATQYIDGFWPFLRREVSRKGVNTGFSETEQRAWLMSLVRVAQWKWWFLDKNRFHLYGGYLKEACARAQLP